MVNYCTYYFLKFLKIDLWCFKIDISIDSDWSYSPHEGFIVQDVKKNLKSGFFQCEARNFHLKQSIMIYLGVESNLNVF